VVGNLATIKPAELNTIISRSRAFTSKTEVLPRHGCCPSSCAPKKPLTHARNHLGRAHKSSQSLASLFAASPGSIFAQNNSLYTYRNSLFASSEYNNLSRFSRRSSPALRSRSLTMSELVIGTPLADALNVAIQSKISDLGWASGSSEVAAMSEYFILLLNDGKTQQEIVSEISGDLLGLGPEDQTAPAFAQWLIEQANGLSSQLAASSAPGSNGQGAVEMADDAMDASFDPSLDMTDAPSNDLNAYVPHPRTCSHKKLTSYRPTGPKAMRAGGMRGGSREKRMVGHINRTLDRSHDSALHRVRGQSGISRGPPTGPRMGAGRQPRTTANRAASVTAGLVNMNGMPMGPGMNGMGGVNGMPPHMPGQYVAPDILAMMEQQNQMLQQMQQQLLIQQSAMASSNNRHGHGRSLFDRSSRGNNFRRGGGHHQHNGHGHQAQNTDAVQADISGQQGEDVEMSQTKREPPNPDEMVCKFNLRCQNKDCKFAHQSPAAPPGVTVDVKDVCTFGAACKNRKCVGRHPSPATKAAHQSEMDCKFFPNCTNPHCPFRHPSMPPCRNGGECKVPNCKFTHVKTACKFNPCTNRTCPFTHEEGQRGTFKDKVWVADESKEHVSERKFVQDNGEEELVLPGSGMVDEGMPEVIL
jgi:nuclear polyadenylated RNA-binding protein NAB2